MDAKWWWLIGMLGPLGAMALVRSLAEPYERWRGSREPGLRIAPNDEILTVAPILAAFFPVVLNLAMDDCIITNESALQDFATSEAELAIFHERVRTHYALDVTTLPDDHLLTIARAISAQARS